MNVNIKKVALLAAVILPVGGIAAQASAAASTVTIGQGDFVTAYSDTRSTGVYGFGPQGLVITTYDTGNAASGQNKVAEYFKPASTTLPATGSLSWKGTTNQPGSQIVFHRAGQTASSDYNVLVGENVYTAGGTTPGANLTDWWYTGGSTKAATKGFTCPSTTGGSGSDCHGTLAQWNAAVPGAVVDVVGFSMGSGVQGEGVLKSLTFDDTTYSFVPETTVVSPPGDPVLPVVDVKGSATQVAKKHKVTFTMKTDATPAGSSQGKPVVWTITVGKKTVYSATEGAGSLHTFAVAPKGNKKHRVTLLLNGAPYLTATVR